MLYVINLPYANFGIIVENDIIIKTPPIGQWMMGRDVSFVSQWVNKKGGTTEKWEGGKNGKNSSISG